MAETLALNAISTLTVHGLISNKDDQSIAIELDRVFPSMDLVPPNLTSGVYWDVDYTNIPAPARPPSKLPPPGSLHVHVQLGEFRGAGRAGVVCDVVPLEKDVQLPPLVSKVAFPVRRASMAREAWFYDELEKLQGAVIPRCYGWFEAKLPEGCSLDPLWLKFNSRNNKNDYDDRHLPEEIEGLRFDPDWGNMLREYHRNNNYVSLLLLERLGGHIPCGVPAPDNLKAELEDMFDDIYGMSVCHEDVHYNNILCAPKEPDALPKLPSPFRDPSQVYSWRIIDLEFCIKINRNNKEARPHSGYLDVLVADIPYGNKTVE